MTTRTRKRPRSAASSWRHSRVRREAPGTSIVGAGERLAVSAVAACGWSSACGSVAAEPRFLIVVALRYFGLVRIYRHIGEVPAAVGRVCACSNFEGLHLGHGQLLAELERRAGGAGWVVFDTRATPAAIGRLSSRRKCFEAFRDAGVEAVVVAPSGDLRRALAAVGSDTVLAYAGETTAVDLAGVAGLEPLPAVEVDGVTVSSQALRQAVTAGDLPMASAMSSRPYSVAGRVVHGFHRGASIGVPTANLRVRGMVLPPDGVYAVEVDGGDLGVGVANLGRNPTFGNHERSLETNIFDLDADLYGRRIEVGFVARLRGEKKFASIDELAAQIRRDIAAARRIHSGHE